MGRLRITTMVGAALCLGAVAGTLGARTFAAVRASGEELPAKVRAVAQRELGDLAGAEAKRVKEAGAPAWEVVVTDAQKRSRSVTIADDGTLLEYEREVEATQLPPGAAASLAAAAAGAKVVRVERIERPIWEVLVDAGGKKHELLLGADGKLVKAPATTAPGATKKGKDAEDEEDDDDEDDDDGGN